MKKRQTLFFIASVMCLGAGHAQTPHFAWAASKLYPNVVWHTESAASADMDCNGKRDLAMLGTGTSGDDKHIEIIIFHDGHIDRPELMEFHSTRLNPKSAQLEVLDMNMTDANFRESLGDTPEGYRQSKTCKSLAINDGEQDRVHIYWNSKTKKFDGWSH